MLPELSGTAITGTNSDPVKTANRSCSPNVMPSVKLVNEEYNIINDGGHESCTNGAVCTRISINGLTASWAHVRSRNSSNN